MTQNNAPPKNISLRDWLAAMALDGLLSAGPNDEIFIQRTVEFAYEIADMMLVEREKGQS